MRKICETLGFDSDSISCFESAYEKISACDGAMTCLDNTKKEMFAGLDSFKEKLPVIAELSGVNRYTSDMVFWLLCAEPLREIYKSVGLPDELCLDGLRDLVYKNRECIKVCGVPGTRTQWFQKFFTLERFALGRLEYDVRVWDMEDYSRYLKKGDHVFGCHIPSSGPLTPESVMDSIKKLYVFAKDKNLLNDGMLAISCATWLIYPPMVELLSKDSNIRQFHDIFDMIIVNHREEDPYPNLEWIFYKGYDGPESLKTMPEDTALQKTLKKFYLEGGTQGVGMGIIIFDGERIVNK